MADENTNYQGLRPPTLTENMQVAASPLDQWALSLRGSGNLDPNKRNHVEYINNLLNGVASGQISEAGAQNIAKYNPRIATYVDNAIYERRQRAQLNDIISKSVDDKTGEMDYRRAIPQLAKLAASGNQGAIKLMQQFSTEMHQRTQEKIAQDRLDAYLKGQSAKSAQEVPVTNDELVSRGAMIKSGMPMSQVIPGYGAAYSKQRTLAQKEALRQIKEENQGMSDQEAGSELARRQIDYVSGKRSIGQLTTMKGATLQAVDQLKYNVDQATGIMKNMQGSDLSPIINAIVRGQQKWTGDPKYSALFFYMNGVANESARIMSGGQASVAQLHEGAREEAMKWANMNMTPKQFIEGVAPAIIKEGEYRVKTYDSAIGTQRGLGQTQQQQGQSTQPSEPKVVDWSELK